MDKLEAVYVKRTNADARARIVVEVYVDADTLKQGEEVVQEALNAAGVADYAVRWDDTKWMTYEQYGGYVEVAAMREL